MLHENKITILSLLWAIHFFMLKIQSSTRKRYFVIYKILYEYNYNKPTTSKSPETSSVSKDGASAETSHWYLPVCFGETFFSWTCVAFDSSSCVSRAQWNREKKKYIEKRFFVKIGLIMCCIVFGKLAFFCCCNI